MGDDIFGIHRYKRHAVIWNYGDQNATVAACFVILEQSFVTNFTNIHVTNVLGTTMGEAVS